MKNNEFKIPVFDGESYQMWRKRIEMFLRMKKCEENITREKTASDTETWDEADLKAINYIYSSISDRQMEFICNETTAYGIMKKFDQMYLKESTAMQIVYRNRLEKLRLKNYSDAATFFLEFEKCVNELKGAGATVTEKEKLNYILNTLPESYSYIGDLIDTLKEEDQTAEYVKNKISIAELKSNHGEASNSNSNAFIVAKNQLKCFKCGKVGHIQRECRNEGQKPNSDSTWRSTRGYRGSRARGSYRGQYRRGTRVHHSQVDAGNDQNSSSRNEPSRNENKGAWIAKVERNTATAYNSKIKNKQCSEIEWILDSGSTDHIVNNDSYFESFEILKSPVNVYLGDNKTVKATKIGNIVSYFDADGKRTEINMKDVLYVKDMNLNLISFSKITDNNKIVSEKNLAKIFNENENLMAVAEKKNGLYHMKSKVKINKLIVNYSNKKVNNMCSKEKWHRLLGHVNFKYLNELCKKQLLNGIPNELDGEFLKCKTCIENKMHNVPFKNNRYRAKELLEIVHTDVCGPFQNTGFRGEKYFIAFIDDYSKIARIYTMKSKAEVSECIKDYVNECENLTGKRVKYLRCDNGKEYLNNEVFKFTKSKGIVISPCPVYVHELNGVAERFNRSVMDMSRCLLEEAQIEKKYWPEIVHAATYLKNRTLTNTIEKKTPYEIFLGKRPDVSHLKIYGSKVFVRKPEQKRISKWDRKAEEGILVGYSEYGYRVLMNNKVIVARHVEVIENSKTCIGLNDDESDIDTSEENDKNSDSEESLDEVFKSPIKDKTKIEKDENQLKIPRKSERVRSCPDRYDEFKMKNKIIANYCRTDIPVTFEEAIQSNESKKWIEAMDKEISGIRLNKTWKLVDSEEKKVIDVKWIYNKKSNGTYKARLVVRGFQQKDEIDDIYAPVANMQTLKILLVYCCKMGLNIEQMDVETAFLNGKVTSEVYVNQPKGYDDGTNRVCKLIKALYGLKESPRAWYECLDKYLLKLGFIRSNVDYCLYTLKLKEDTVYLLIYVDDLLICSKNIELIKKVKKMLSDKFKMKDLGKIKEYLGIIITYDVSRKEMKLTQKEYIRSLAEKYDVENCKTYKTPMEVNLKLEKSDDCERDIKYRNLIGALLYISSATRPDISFAVNYLSRFQNCYNNTHFKYALRILKYLYVTRDLSLSYNGNKDTEIIDCYVDADWAGDNIDRKSTTGFVIRLFGNVVYWKSRKQKSVTKASTFAEYVALSEAVTEIKLITEVLRFFDIECKRPINVYEDNSGAINIAKYGNFTKNSKHIEVHYHYVHENVNEGKIDIVKVNSNDNIADILTKSLSREKYEKFRDMLNVI